MQNLDKMIKYKLKGKLYVSTGSDKLIIGETYDGNYIPRGWLWRISDCYANDHSNWIKIEDNQEVTEVKALRYNSDKPKYSLLDFSSLEDTVKVLDFGAQKYARDNFKKGFPFSTVLDSMLRHIKGLQAGEWLDPESGLPHIGHIGCNAMFLGLKTNTMDLPLLEEEFKKWKG